MVAIKILKLKNTYKYLKNIQKNFMNMIFHEVF